MTRARPARLFHYTCAHAAPLIDADGVLRPWPDAAARARHARPGGQLADWPLPDPLVWLTDLDSPLRDALGLTSVTLGDCDRAEVRYVTAAVGLCQPWTAYARALPPGARRRLEEAAPGLLPWHWWVSQRPVPIIAAGERLAGAQPC